MGTQANHRSCTKTRINNWTLQEQTSDEQEYMQPLFVFVLNQFAVVFGDRLLEKEPAIVYNDSRAPYPMLLVNQTPIKIRTSVEELSYWSQFIFQLSHELMHYITRQCRNEGEIEIMWFEETICEAMSLYILKLHPVHPKIK